MDILDECKGLKKCSIDLVKKEKNDGNNDLLTPHIIPGTYSHFLHMYLHKLTFMISSLTSTIRCCMLDMCCLTQLTAAFSDVYRQQRGKTTKFKLDCFCHPSAEERERECTIYRFFHVLMKRRKACAAGEREAEL